MTQIVDGKKIADEILADLKLKIQRLEFKPRLVVVLVGQNPASLSYTKMKQKRGEEIGIKVDVRNYPEDISQEELIKEIQNFNKAQDVRGIIVQLPLPKHLDRDKILNAVDPKLDVDCLTTFNKRKLIENRQPYFTPPAAAAVMKILEYYKVFPSPGLPRDQGRGRNILVVGSGDLIGKPLSAIFLNKKIAFKLANRHTENLNELVASADIIITGVGKAGLITGDMIKEGAIVIDAGTTGSDEGEIVGDVDTKSVTGKASFLAPVPGGVGPVTVAMLLNNLVQASG